jgi:hypothetical protein
MKSATILILLMSPLALLKAQTQPAAPAQAAATAAGLKEQLVASVREDIAKLDGDDTRLAGSLDRFLHSLQNISPDGLQETELQRLGMYLPSGGISNQTRTLLESYSKQVKSEAEALRRKFADEFAVAGRDFVKRAMAAENSLQVNAIGDEIQEYAAKVTQRSIRDSGTTSAAISSLKSTVSQIERFQAARADENWSNAAGMLEQMRESLVRIRQFIPADEAEAFLEAARKSIGLLSPQEMQQEFEKTLAELFDDAKQDRLDEIADRIRKYQQLVGSSSSSSAQAALASRWRNLGSLATSFIQNVQLVKNGGVSQFTPDQWLRSNSESKPLMSRDELTERLKNYKVSVTDDSGNAGTEPMYHDIREVLGRIQSLADVRRELPAFTKAVRQSGYQSESTNWSYLATALAQYAEIHAKLEAGTAFTLRGFENLDYGDPRRQYPPGTNDLAAAKIASLHQQLHWMILPRFLPELAADTGGSPRSALVALHEKAVAEKNYDAVLALNQLSAYFTPGQPLVEPAGIAAIQHYLAGVRQEEQLGEPRLATYYYQKAAAIRSSPVPLDDLKARLQRLKKDFPADYEKGTDDFFKPYIDEGTRLTIGALIVPAKK